MMMCNSSIFASFNFGFGCFGLPSHQIPFTQLTAVVVGAVGWWRLKYSKKENEYLISIHQVARNKEKLKDMLMLLCICWMV